MRGAILTLMLGLAAACGDDGDPPRDAAPVSDGGIDGPATVDAACFDNPQSHDEIINACTTAQKIYKASPAPPLLLPDGGLPTLPP